MHWGMGKGAWAGLGLRFKRNYPGRGIEYTFPKGDNGGSGGHAVLVAADRASLQQGDGEDEEMRQVRRRAGLLRLSDG